MRRNAFLAGLLLSTAGLSATTPVAAQFTYELTAPPPHGFDRAQAQTDTEAHLVKLVGIDTQNPPGNERRAAKYLESALSGVSGIETQVIEMTPGRANFIAHLRATSPSQRPVLIMHHLDVVGVDLAKWQTPPFEPTVRDGYLYGRGAIDDKGMLAASMTALLCLAKQRDALDRDIILLATAGEEGGGEGIRWILEREFSRIEDAEFALNEGGRIRSENGRIPLVNIQTTEKIPYNILMTADGPSGHASIPLANNALAALARAVARVHEWKAPVRLNETTRSYFSGLARLERDPTTKRAMETLASSRDSVAIDQAAEVVSREHPGDYD